MRWLLYISFLASAFAQSFLSFTLESPPLIEWDQQPYTFYTGQSMNFTWTTQNILATEFARIQYPGAGGTRTLTTGSGAPIGNGQYAVRLSDSSNGIATNVVATIALSSNTAISRTSAQSFSVIQSKIQNIVPLDGNRALGGGQNTVCDDRNLTVTWRGLGRAQFGTATVSLSKVSGSAGTLGTTQTNIPVSGNNTITIFCPRTSVPSTFSQYAFQISVSESGGNAYTGTSASFTVVVAPTPSNTPSRTPSSTNTPTPSPSFSNTPTSSPSFSNTPTSSPSVTSSQTSTPTSTPSPTPTANPSIDYAAIARAAAESVDTTTPAVAGAFGGIGGILVLLGIGKWYHNKRMTEQRKKRLAMSNRLVRETQSLYGITPPTTTVGDQPSIVMYTVQNMPTKNQLQGYKKPTK